MEEEAAAAAAGVEVVALRSLGLGFDLACDFRLRFAKPFPGDSGGRLVQLDEKNTHDIAVPGGPTIAGVSRDIGCDKGDRTRFRSDVLEFNQAGHRGSSIACNARLMLGNGIRAANSMAKRELLCCPGLHTSNQKILSSSNFAIFPFIRNQMARIMEEQLL